MNYEFFQRRGNQRSIKIKQIVLDPFMGSGTTAVAARLLNRRFLGFEANKEYCNSSRERLEKIISDNGANKLPVLQKTLFPQNTSRELKK